MLIDENPKPFFFDNEEEGLFLCAGPLREFEKSVVTEFGRERWTFLDVQIFELQLMQQESGALNNI